MSSSRFIWYELATFDLEGARVFYGGVLGWSFIEFPGVKFSILSRHLGKDPDLRTNGTA